LFSSLLELSDDTSASLEVSSAGASVDALLSAGVVTFSSCWVAGSGESPLEQATRLPDNIKATAANENHFLFILLNPFLFVQSS